MEKRLKLPPSWAASFRRQSAVPTLRCHLRAPRFPLNPGSFDHVAPSQCFSHASSGSYHLLVLYLSPSCSFLSHTSLIQANVSLSYSSLDSVVSNLGSSLAREPRLIFCSLFELNILPSQLNLLWAFDLKDYPRWFMLWCPRPHGWDSLSLRFLCGPHSFFLIMASSVACNNPPLPYCATFSSFFNSPRSGWCTVRDGDSNWECRSHQAWIVFIILWGWEADWQLDTNASFAHSPQTQPCTLLRDYKFLIQNVSLTLEWCWCLYLTSLHMPCFV